MPKVRADKKRTAHVFDSKWRSTDVILKEEADFTSLLLSERVLKGLKKAGFKKPSPIQLEAIPFGRYGKDLFIQAKSGTGKTLVFTIVALEMLQDVRCPQVLVLAPTREIADQIREVVTSVGAGFKNLMCCSFIGGMPVQEDRAKGHSCQIAVGTPGRVKQLIAEGALPTNSIRLFILDEADVLLRDNSFSSIIADIFHSLPKEKQVIATSATYPSNIKQFVNDYFRDPYLTRLEKENVSLLGTIHYEQEVPHSSIVMLAYKIKVKALEKILKKVKFSQCLIFCNQLTMVEFLCKDIKNLGFTVTYISSAKEQKDRLKAIDALKRFKCKILICSDLTSRGIDAENVDMIINFDCPKNTETYLHRVGRAGRYGARGVAITFRTKEENMLLRRFQKDANFKVHRLPDPLIRDLINFEPNDSSDSEILSEDLELQNGHTDCKDNAKVQMGSSKEDAESTVPTMIERKEGLENSNIQNETYGKVEGVLHSKFEFLDEMKGEEALITPDFDQNFLSKKADSVKDAKEKKSTGPIRKEVEVNVNLESLLNNSKNNHSDNMKNSEVDNCGSKELGNSSYINKISVDNENNCKQFETKSTKKLLQDTLQLSDVPNHSQNMLEEISLLTEQTGIVLEANKEQKKETANKQVNAALSETNLENDKAEGSAYSGNIISHSVSKFIHNMEKNGHSLSKEEIIESNQGISIKSSGLKSVSQNDVNILKSKNSKFFHNVLANLVNNKLIKKENCVMNTDENNLVKDPQQTVFKVPSSEKTSLEDVLDNKDVLKSAPSIKSDMSHNKNSGSIVPLHEKSIMSSTMDSFKHEIKGEVIYCSPDAGSLISNYFESSNDKMKESSDKTCECNLNKSAEFNQSNCDESSFNESVGCGSESEGLSHSKSEESSYVEIEESDDEKSEACGKESKKSSDLETKETSNKESEESSELDTDESSNQSNEEASDLETDESSNATSEESSDLETEESSEDSSEESSSDTESSSTDVSDSDNKQISDFEHASSASSKSSCTPLQNKRLTQIKNNKKVFKVKQERFKADDSHSKTKCVDGNLYCSSSSRHSNLSNPVLKRETQKPFCRYAKASANPRHDRKAEQDRKTNRKSFSTKSNPEPFYRASTSSCPQENHSSHLCCCCQHIKCPNYGHSSKLNSVRYDCQGCGPANRHFHHTAVNLGNQDYVKKWYQTFYKQNLWIQQTAFNMSKHF